MDIERNKDAITLVVSSECDRSVNNPADKSAEKHARKTIEEI